jgi:hypothetical protein
VSRRADIVLNANLLSLSLIVVFLCLRMFFSSRLTCQSHSSFLVCRFLAVNEPEVITIEGRCQTAFHGKRISALYLPFDSVADVGKKRILISV